MTSNPTKQQRVSDERLAALIQYGAPGGLAPHDLVPIAQELQEMRAQIGELKRLLKYAVVYSSFAKHMPESFLKDATEALSDD